MLDELNEKQRQEVLNDANTILLAIPGSGKSKVVISKIVYLISRGVTNIVAATFTRAAADGFKQKLYAILGYEIDTVKIGTFHSLLIGDMSEHSNSLMVSVDEQVNVLHKLYFRFNGRHTGLDDEIIQSYHLESTKSLDQTYYSLNDLIKGRIR